MLTTFLFFKRLFLRKKIFFRPRKNSENCTAGWEKIRRYEGFFAARENMDGNVFKRVFRDPGFNKKTRFERVLAKTRLKYAAIHVFASYKKTFISTNFFPSDSAIFRIFSGSKKKYFFFLKKKDV